MSFLVDQQEKFADDGNSEMSACHEAGCLKNTESSDCQSSSNVLNEPGVSSEPRDENQCQWENILAVPVKQEISKGQIDDSERLEGETSDCTLLLDGHCSRTNGESCFENENAFQADEVLQPQAQVGVGSPRRCEKEDENSSLDNYEDPQNVAGKRTNNFQPQSEILLQPLSLCAESSRSEPGREEELETNSHLSVHFKKSTGITKYSSPTAEHAKSDVGTDPPSSVHFRNLTGTKEYPSPTAQHGRAGFGSDSLSSDHFMKPTGVREHSSPTAQDDRAELGTDPPGSVRFIKPTGTRQQSSATSERGRANRNIFGSGGAQMRNLPEGTSYSGPGLEKIEHLSIGESSPEPQIVISPTSSSDEPRVNLCLLVKGLLCRWFGFLKQRTCRQFAKAPLFYLFSTLVIMTCLILANHYETDRDIPIAILSSFATFILITLGVDRGQFSNILGGCKSCIPECRKACRNSDTCIPWCCCKSEPEPHLERHSQYLHLEEDGAFKHEIADVSRLGPKDCPRIKMVELRGSEHEESPDYGPELSQVNADVHVGKREGERLGAARKHIGMDPARTGKQHKTRSDRPRTGASKTFRADIHATIELSPPELSPIQETAFDEGNENGEEQPTNSDASGISTMKAGKTPKNNLEDASTNDDDIGESESFKSTKNSPRFPGGDDFKKFTDCSPTLQRFAKIHQSDCLPAESGESTSPEDEVFPVLQVSDPVEFICEHYGQSVACSCAALMK